MKNIFKQFKKAYYSWKQSRIIRDFNKLYYDGIDKPLFDTISWFGVKILKCPFDLWVYQEILFNTKPDVIVETGVYCGGSTFYLASLCDLLGSGEILACDITLAKVDAQVRNHPRIELFEGSSIDPKINDAIARRCKGRRTMVILDSNHHEKHVLEELRMWSPLVTPGCYLICEDTNINGHPVYRNFGPGPFEAVKKFLAENEGWRVDTHCERLVLTFNPSGYLLRTQ